jgi:HSP20 family protein
MNDPFGHLERLERELGAVAFQLTSVQFSRFGGTDRWRPHINAYRCTDRFIVCADLAGVDKSTVKLVAERRRLTLSGTRPPPEPACDPSQPIHVIEMEIDYGPFARVVDLPADIDTAAIKAEYDNGLLWLSLPMRSPS